MKNRRDTGQRLRQPYATARGQRRESLGTNAAVKMQLDTCGGNIPTETWVLMCAMHTLRRRSRG
jgi:hypothetical protein